MAKRWTDEEIATMGELKTSGKTNQEIADILGRSLDAIKKKSSEVGAVTANTIGGTHGKELKRELKYGEDDLPMLIEKYRTSTNYNNHKEADGLPPLTWITRKWGSWTNARNALGLEKNRGQFESETILYCLYFPEEDFYKVGITQRSIVERFRGYPEYEVVSETLMPTKASAKEAEKTLFIGKPYEPLHPMFHKKTGGGAGGKTECFKL